MKMYAYSNTQAGIARRQQERGQPIAAIEAVREEIAPVGTPVANNVLRFRRPPIAHETRRMSSASEFSRAKHMAFLDGLHIATQTPIRVLINRIAAWHGMTHADIMSKTRKRKYVNARDDAIAAVKALKPKDGGRLSYSLPMVGRIFGGMDHTTVLASLRRTAKRRGT